MNYIFYKTQKTEISINKKTKFSPYSTTRKHNSLFSLVFHSMFQLNLIPLELKSY